MGALPIELRGCEEPRGCEYPPLEAVDGELPENWGAGRTCTKPVFATSWFMCPRFRMEPRGIPMPAEPECTTIREANAGDVFVLPITTVFTPLAGGTGAFTWTSVVLVYRGTVTQVVHMPGCHIQPKPGTNIQFP